MYTSLYKDSIYVRTENQYEFFNSKLKDFDHYKIVLKVYRLLRKEGFAIRTLKYHQHNNYHQERNKVAIKDFIAVKMEVSNRNFKIEICHLQNLESELELNIWRDNDDRYKSYSYLEGKKIELIRKKIERLLPSKQYDGDDKLSALELILKCNKENSHVHNGATSFEEIKQYVENDKNKNKYQRTYNYTDQNKKLIVCGETKYFYDYKNNRLSCGIALHNINNMWWVLLSDGSRRNIACFDLFDYSENLPRRKPSISKLKAFYHKQIQLENFERCIKLKKVIENL